MSTFVLVHGAWHDSRCWQFVVPHLQAAGHHVLTPDLPGHGDSTLAPQRATLKAYVHTVSELVNACPEAVILVGHSMAGVVITEVAVALPSHIQQLVYLCAYLPKPSDSVFSLIASNRGHEPLTPIELAINMSTDKRICTLETDSILPLFYGETSDEVTAVAVSRLQNQGSLPLATPVNYDPKVFSDIVKRYICCNRDKVLPLHHQRRMLANVPCQRIQELETDHSPFYSCPQKLANILLDQTQ